jgi:hypothetical protein
MSDARENRKRVWRIAWRNRDTGMSGRGVVLHTRAEAEKICEDANAIRPEIDFTPEHAGKAQEEAA